MAKRKKGWKNRKNHPDDAFRHSLSARGIDNAPRRKVKIPSPLRRSKFQERLLENSLSGREVLSGKERLSLKEKNLRSREMKLREQRIIEEEHHRRSPPISISPPGRYGDYRDISAQQLKTDILKRGRERRRNLQMSRAMWSELSALEKRLRQKRQGVGGLSKTVIEKKLTNRLHKLRRKYDWWGEFVNGS